MKTAARMHLISPALVTAVCLALVSGCGKDGNKSDGSGNSKDKPAAKEITGNEAKIEAIRQAGEPTTVEELNAWYVEPPAGQNAAPLYADAFAAIVVSDQKLPTFVTGNQGAIELLQSAAARKQCRYPIDLTKGWNTLLPHLAKIKNSAQLLQQDAISKAAKGRTDLATPSISAGLGVARSLEQEPVLISQLVRAATLELAVTGLEQSLNRKPFPEAQLAGWQAGLAEAEEKNAPAFCRALIAERVMGLNTFKSPGQIPGLLQSAEGGESSNPTADPAVSKMMENHKQGPAFEQDMTFFLDSMENMIAAAKSPFPSSLDAANNWNARPDEAKQKSFIFSAMFLPALAKTIEKSATAESELRVAQAALAVERYRIANKAALPDSLTLLVPQYLKAVPTDPFDGAPLRYKKNSPRGYTVYSLGPDRQDDGGIHKPARVTKGAKYDLAFTVAR